MENRWILIIVVILASMPIQVMAYNNIGAHPSINRYAVDYFEKELLPEGASIRGEESWGYAWDESDGREEYWGVRHTVSERRSKLLQDWIKDGGFSADEPELNMGLVHFYDPTNINEPWLTDPKFLMDNKFLEYVAYARDPYLVIRISLPYNGHLTRISGPDIISRITRGTMVYGITRLHWHPIHG